MAEGEINPRLAVEITNQSADTEEKTCTVFNNRPELGCECTVIIKPQSAEPSLLSKYPLNTNFTLVIGESDDEYDDVVENVVVKMQIGECRTLFIRQTQDSICVSETVEDAHVGLSENMEAQAIEITLVDIKNKLPVCFWTLQEKYETALHHKEAGVKLFQGGLVDRAFKRFSLAVKYLILMHPQKNLPAGLSEKYLVLRTQTYCNMAACQLKFGSFQYVIDNCTKALDLDPANVKCLYRRAEAYLALKKFELCRNDVRKGLSLEPNSKSFLTLLQKIEKEVTENKTNLKKS